ncbi:uncharacterized protein LDX57_001198 [Aspergillus melleus]|uniref:uncharacterized protein n=1 Tax=Aspergillus melleus TaxID=138277 RepID=UPI001E8D2574|nr:uncharacterized protein LDX57_001198 [Aspergillus melleus]KAH8423437.1 hypothetical protein LDX57_001198 [Aspergillus melleus]
MKCFKTQAEKEEELEKAGEWLKAQQMRRDQNSHFLRQLKLATKELRYIKLNIRQRTLVQRESALKSQKHRLCNQERSPVSSEKIDKINLELAKINEQYWQFERDDYELLIQIPDGPLKRGITSTRSRENAHMTEWLKQDCAARGGCCSHSCGCCEKPRSETRSPNRGHCTAACECCEERRGFHVDTSHGEDPSQPWDTLGPLSGASYKAKLVDAYVFGTI